MRQSTRSSRRLRSMAPAVLAAVAALILTACGEQAQDLLGLASDDGESATSDAESEDTADDGSAATAGDADAADDGYGSAADGSDDEVAAGEDPDGDAAEDDASGAAPETVGGSCDLAAGSGTTQLDVDAYEQLMLATNFDLELLVMDLGADLDELLSGGSDGPTLEGQLTDHLATYQAVTADVADVVPPAGAEAWHARAVESFEGVCLAIGDGLAGSAQGDEERFADYVEALTEFPSLLNELHANAACGPFETC